MIVHKNFHIKYESLNLEGERGGRSLLFFEKFYYIVIIIINNDDDNNKPIKTINISYQFNYYISNF